MPTAPSWTDLRTGRNDLAALLVFRRDGLSAVVRRRLRRAGAGVLLATAAMLAFAAWLPGPGLEREHAGRVLAVLPSGMLGFLTLAVLASASTGGGREVVPRDQLVAYPVSAVTQHLGALLMAPLNIAWLMQSWLLLGSTAYALGTHGLLAALVPVILWIVLATVAGQVVGWLLEGVRRGRRGTLVGRALVVVLGGALAALVLTGRLTDVLDRSPTRSVLVAVLAGSNAHWIVWARVVVVLLAITAAVTYAGCLAADWALGRPEREELRLESGRRRPRPQRQAALPAMMRVDRAGVWRSVPLRRGITVLALMPGLVALAGGLEWQTLTVLPGLVVSGGALLFGVNAWCLDGRGALWRESLPGSPTVAFWARVLVLGEVLLVASTATSAMAVLRAGRPTASELAALLCVSIVVMLQVLGACLRWSVQRPFASDLRSARATPAPPMVMVGYSARLACTTTVTGLVFGAVALQPDWRLPVLIAAPMALWSAYRLVGTADSWTRPAVRAQVLQTVIG